MQFEWQSPDGASQAQVSIEASEDLDRWRVLVLQHAAAGDSRQRAAAARTHRAADATVRLPARAANGRRSAARDQSRDRRARRRRGRNRACWFLATTLADDIRSLFFDSARRAPVTTRGCACSRTTARCGYRCTAATTAKRRGSSAGAAHRIVTDTDRRESPPAHFEATSDRYWRLRIAKDPQLYRATQLELGYRPARLRFLAQGSGPFTLAYGEPARGD